MNRQVNTPEPDTRLLERILWSQIAQLLHETPPAWDEHSASARAIRAVLHDTALDPEELAIAQRWDAGLETTRALFDRLLQARVNRAAGAGLHIEADRLGVERPAPPRIAVVRGEEGPRSLQAGRKTAIELLRGTQIVDIAGLGPGEHLDDIVDLLVLANQSVAHELQSTLRVEASFHHEDEPFDLLTPHSPSVQVFDLERSLAQLEELLHRALPEDLRRKIAGDASFDRDLTNELLGGKYRIKDFKGKGAFKSVYEGVDEMLGARVAIAVLNPKGARSRRALQHFQDEARVLTTLDHENIVRWVTFDRTADGLHYFVMEYLDGEELEKVLRRDGRMAPRRVAQLLLQVLSALRRAHALGKRGRLLHLDLKPDNVFVLPPLAPGDPERVKVIDFGIGQHVGAEVRAAERPDLSTIYDLPTEDLGKSIGSVAIPEDESGLPGRVQRARGGTLLYASPEQCKHLAGHRDIVELDGRSDLYSLGVMAFRMLTGQFPFEKCESAYQAIDNHLNVAPRKVGSLGIRVPRKLAAFVDRCLRKDRDARWKDADEAYKALYQFVNPRASSLKVAVPIVAVAAIAVWLVWNNGELPGDTFPVQEGDVTVTEAYFGPDRPTRQWSMPPWRGGLPNPVLQLVDPMTGDAAHGWTLERSRPELGLIEISAELASAASTTAQIELRGGRRVGRSNPFRLVFLPRPRVKADIPDVDTHDVFDPHGHKMSIEVTCIPKHLKRVVLIDGTATIPVNLGEGVPAGEGTRYTVSIPDALFTGVARDIELLVRAYDAAEQSGSDTLDLRIAGHSVDFSEEPTFVAPGDGDWLELDSSSGVQAIRPGDALRIATTGKALARIYRHRSATQPIEVLIPEDGSPRFVDVDQLSVNGDIDHGEFRIELTEPWIQRIGPKIPPRHVAFAFDRNPPDILAVFQTRDGEKALQETANGTDSHFFCVHESARLRVSTSTGANTLIEVSWAAEGQPEQVLPVELTNGGLIDRIITFPASGTYTIVVRSFVPLLVKNVKGPQRGLDHVYKLEVDCTKPELDVEYVGDRVVRKDSVVQLLARARDQSPLASFRYEVDGLTPIELITSSLGSETEEVDLSPSVVALDLPDGPHSVRVVVTDKAGNSDEHTETWQVARQGPEIVLEQPRDPKGREWLLLPEGSLKLRINASDPNEVQSVHVQLSYDGEKYGKALALQPAGGGAWEGTTTVPTFHEGDDLALDIVAVDGYGNQRPEHAVGTVPENIQRSTPSVIVPSGSDGTSLVEIRVPAELPYVFGGRRTDRSGPGWDIEFSGAEIGPYFLDSREVTRGEFRAFLEAKHVQLVDVVLGHERLARLLSELEGNPDVPVAGVTWLEAQAFAHSRGKRLPTLLEWEFAVRRSSYRTEPPEERLHGAPDTWPANLCTGAWEWTAMPDLLEGESLDKPSQYRKYKKRLLSGTGSRAVGAVPAVFRDETPSFVKSYWVAGSGQAPGEKWAATTLRVKDATYSDVGFRCALDYADARELLKSGDYKQIESEE